MRDLANAVGIVTHRSYNTFGVLTDETANAVDCIFGYTGKMFDEVTELQNNVNRWYNPELGKWLSEDPIGFDGMDANLYCYVGNAVITLVDVNGLECSGDDPKEYWGESIYLYGVSTETPGYQGIGTMTGTIKAAEAKKREALVQEMRNRLKQCTRHLDKTIQAELLANLDHFIFRARHMDNRGWGIADPCTVWTRNVWLPVGRPGIIEYNERSWDYRYSAWIFGDSDYVSGHATIEVNICGERYYFDNGWWGHLFKDIPITVKPSTPRPK